MKVKRKEKKSANESFRDDKRLGFPGGASSQQIHNTKITISVSSDENDALPLKNNTKKLKKVTVHDSVNLPSSMSYPVFTLFQVSRAILKHIFLNRLFIFYNVL